MKHVGLTIRLRIYSTLPAFATDTIPIGRSFVAHHQKFVTIITASGTYHINQEMEARQEYHP